SSSDSRPPGEHGSAVPGVPPGLIARLSADLAGVLSGQLRPRADVELLVDLGQVPLDRLRADEQRVGDLLIRSTLRDQGGDLRLGGRQRAGLRTPAAELGELDAGLLGP